MRPKPRGSRTSTARIATTLTDLGSSDTAARPPELLKIPQARLFGAEPVEKPIPNPGVVLAGNSGYDVDIRPVMLPDLELTGYPLSTFSQPELLSEHPVRPSLALQRHRDTIRQVVNSHRAQNARIFGSVAQGTDVEGSDLDILVDPTPDTTLFDIGAIRHELLQRLGIPVDVLTPNALPDEFRAAVLAGAIPL